MLTTALIPFSRIKVVVAIIRRCPTQPDTGRNLAKPVIVANRFVEEPDGRVEFIENVVKWIHAVSDHPFHQLFYCTYKSSDFLTLRQIGA